MPRLRPLLTALAALPAACASGPRGAVPVVTTPAPIAPTDPRFAMGSDAARLRARADSLRYPWTRADADFMTGMIHHHAQAILISRWAPSHGASPAVQRLTARIINAQRDEITLMQTWLADRDQPVPRVDSLGNVTMPEGAHAHGAHAMHMPGMLTDEQLRELDAARGETFDKLFLQYMIQHHQGAVTMVRDLYANPGAAQDETVFKFANDVEVDQSTEIRRMLTMLLEMGVVPPA